MQLIAVADPAEKLSLTQRRLTIARQPDFFVKKES